MNETNGGTATNNTQYQPVQVTLETLLEAGAHFGHKTDNWNPKMLPFIYGKKNDVYVINLDLTLEYFEKCRKAVRDMAANGKTFLFVGTKDQAKDVVAEAATRCGAFYINNRWLGGTLTNFDTIKKSISKMNRMEDFLTESEKPDTQIKIGKKEKISIRKDINKLAINLAGIRNMKNHPDVIFVIDVKKDEIAVAEARRLHIPVIALVDTNTDPRVVDYQIPANDDSKASIYLFANALADAIADGYAEYESSGRARKDREQNERREAQAEAQREERRQQARHRQQPRGGQGRGGRGGKGKGQAAAAAAPAEAVVESAETAEVTDTEQPPVQ
jgi:small subunit ribosomal protein S2